MKKRWFILPILILAILLGLLIDIAVQGTGGISYYEFLRIGGVQDSYTLMGGDNDSYIVIGSRPRPLPATALHIIALTQDSISLAWQCESTVGTYFIIAYKTTGFPADSADGTIINNNEITSVTVDNLTSGDTYYFGVWSTLAGWPSLTGAFVAATTHSGYPDPDYGSDVDDDTDESILGNSPIGGFIDFMSQYGRLPEKTVGILGYSSLLLFLLLGVACYNRSVAMTIICGIGGLALGVSLGVFALVFLIIAVVGGLALGTLRGGQPS